MPYSANEDSSPPSLSEKSARDGILPYQDIAALQATGAVTAVDPFTPQQIQPASLDLRLGGQAHRIRASFLPGPTVSVADKLNEVTLHTIALDRGAVLETGCVYVVPLQERLALPDTVAAAANPKSSTGRLDVFTRVIADGVGAFDRVPAGYRGPLYAEISPRTFPILVRAGSRLSQIRFRTGTPLIEDAALRALNAADGVVSPGAAVIDQGVHLSIDLRSGPDGLIGYRARRHASVIDVDQVDAYEVADFWDPVHLKQERSLVLDPGEFYILMSREAVKVPPSTAAEMVPFDPLVGEFRVHYAGFFDPGFGYGADGEGARAVLEVRSYDVPFLLDHGQTIGRLVYERMHSVPDTLYGTALGSTYQAQRLKLSKHFRSV